MDVNFTAPVMCVASADVDVYRLYCSTCTVAGVGARRGLSVSIISRRNGTPVLSARVYLLVASVTGALIS